MDGNAIATQIFFGFVGCGFAVFVSLLVSGLILAIKDTFRPSPGSSFMNLSESDIRWAHLIDAIVSFIMLAAMVLSRISSIEYLVGPALWGCFGMYYFFTQRQPGDGEEMTVHAQLPAQEYGEELEPADSEEYLNEDTRYEAVTAQ